MSLLKSTVLITIFNAIGIVLSFAVNIFIASYFGAGREMDIYITSSTLPIFISALLSGSISTCFIPLFIELRNNEVQNKWEIVLSILNTIMLFSLLICVIIILFAHQIISFLAPGFSIADVNTASDFLKLQSLLILFTTIIELFTGLYYSNNKFLIPLLFKIIGPAITITSVYFLHTFFSIKSLIFATLLGILVQSLILVISYVKKNEFHYFFKIKFNNKVIGVFKLMLPLIGGMLFYRAMPIFDRYLGSQLPQGSISHLGYAFKLFSQIPLIISSGIALSMFPIISKLAVEGNFEELKIQISKSVRIILFAAIPITAIVGLFCLPIVQFVFQRGAFSYTDSLLTSKALSFYMLALPIAVVGDITSKVFYATKDTVTPAVIGIFELVVYVIVAFLLFKYMGYLALPIAYAVYFNFSVINIWYVRKKIGGIDGLNILKSIGQFLISVGLSIIIIFAIWQLSNIIIYKLFLISIAFVIYFIVNYLFFKNEESKYYISFLTKLLK